MMGILYLILCFLLGWSICEFAFPDLGSLTQRSYGKGNISVSPYLLLFPAWYVTGTMVLTWGTYLIALLFADKREPLFYANLIVMPLALLVSVIFLSYKVRNRNRIKTDLFSKDCKIIRLELAFVAVVALLAGVLMWLTFFIQGSKLYVGVSVFSDFSPHIGMIRSFSYGNNFPTAYSHYAGEDIKYHFMFQFLAGNLEYLGMRLDYAFNIPSMLSFISAFFVLYVLAVKITGNYSAGLLSCLFFAFRSSRTLFTYLSKLPEGTNILKALADNTSFLSDTPHEDWGLWNLNVYCNQRHLAFGLTVMFLVILLFIPRVFQMFEDLRQNNRTELIAQRRIRNFQILFLTKEAWRVHNYRQAVAVGVLLGSLGFFHGAAVIGCLSILFIMAIVSKHRIEYVITAVIALVLSLIQTKLFIDGSAVEPQFFFGFIAENKTMFGVASYLGRLLGILPFVILSAFCLERGARRYIILAFAAPLIFAFTISLTVDVTVNHKYIMMSCILLGIVAASLISGMLKHKDAMVRILSVCFIFLLTATGLYDFTVVIKKNSPETAVTLDLEDPLTVWIHQNSSSRDIFLTSNYALNQVVLGGAMLYEGWPYFPWSAGYDTDYRTAQVKRMYEAKTPQELMELVKENQIRFIIVDQDNRESSDYKINEDNIRAAYTCVYTQGEGVGMTSIYDTEKPVE